MTLRIGCSGMVPMGSGIGVLQRALYPRLASLGTDLTESRNRHLGNSLPSRLKGLALGLSAARGEFDAYLSTVPPLPLSLPAPTVAMVYDLRWRDTRGRLGGSYRKWDLSRTVKHSTHMICISERTRNDLIEVFPEAADRATVAWLGPGLIGSLKDSEVLREEDLVLLIGSAAHKRNEYAAEVLAAWASTRPLRVAGVGLSARARETLEQALGRAACEWYSGIPDESVERLYRRASHFVLFGRDEGFGLPYIEALSAGASVIALDQPLTREILGESAILVPDSGAAEAAEFIQQAATPALEDRFRVASKYSWDSFADSILHALLIAKETTRD